MRVAREVIYFVTSTPEPDFEVESWLAKGNLETLRQARWIPSACACSD